MTARFNSKKMLNCPLTIDNGVMMLKFNSQRIFGTKQKKKDGCCWVPVHQLHTCQWSHFCFLYIFPDLNTPFHFFYATNKRFWGEIGKKSRTRQPNGCEHLTSIVTQCQTFGKFIRMGKQQVSYRRRVAHFLKFRSDIFSLADHLILLSKYRADVSKHARTIPQSDVQLITVI
jgi:hypothetical protein